MKNKRLYFILTVVIILLLIPLLAMQFTTEVNWSVLDFVIAGILLFGAGLIFEAVVRIVKNKKTRIIIILTLLILFILIWAELAVGIFGTTFAGN